MWPVGFCPFTNLKMYSTAKKRPKSVQNFAKYSIYLQKYSQILPMWRNFAKPGHTWLSEQSFAPDEAKINFFFFFENKFWKHDWPAAAAAYRVLCLRGGGDCDGDILQIPTTLMCVFLFFSLDKVKSKLIHLLSFQLVLLLWKFVQ